MRKLHIRFHARPFNETVYCGRQLYNFHKKTTLIQAIKEKWHLLEECGVCEDCLNDPEVQMQLLATQI